MELSPELLTLDAVTAADDGEAALFPVRLWDYGSPDEFDPTAETVLIIHGRRGSSPDRSEPLGELYSRLTQLAEQTAEQGKRVLFLDWGEAATGSLPPFGPARRIKAVADWAVEQLQPLELSSLTLVGHSLGSYVAAEIAATFTGPSDPPPFNQPNQPPEQGAPQPTVNLVALDPAFPAQDYDIDGLTEGRQAVADFSPAASLAFVAQDDLFQTGLAGDNQQAATAETSFVVDLDGLRGIFDADSAHSAVIDVYRDFERYLQPADGATAWVLAQFPRDRVGDGGGFSDSGLHEGRASAEQSDDDIWKVFRIEGDGVALHFVAQADDALTLGGSEGLGSEGLDIIASLTSLRLPAGFEHLVLGGKDDLNGTGQGSDNVIYGNRGRNDLRGLGGDDDIYGGDGDDILGGDGGGDRLLGQRGEDYLVGDAGNDLLMGGAQADRLSGGRGRNRLRGGGGRDTFVLQPMAGIDIVEDFQDGLDQLAIPAELSLDDLQLIARGGDLLIRGAGDAIALLVGIPGAQLDAADFTVAKSIDLAPFGPNGLGPLT